MKNTEMLKKARLELLDNGWEYICSVMANGTETKNFGQQFSKGGITFFLNIETMHNLPQH